MTIDTSFGRISTSFSLTKAVTLTLVLILIKLSNLPLNRSECCRPDVSGYCFDCSLPTFMYCAAGNGSCNIFGCNCDDECRAPPEGKQACASSWNFFYSTCHLIDKVDKC
ncbi:unnamed protein product [Orchesella dallaii]|uniref:Uncharacterized protein n=1 Tax=Orchesella dallaii TaxID=48710 RepID=A0ABP1PIU4_9HEXA